MNNELDIASDLRTTCATDITHTARAEERADALFLRHAPLMRQVAIHKMHVPPDVAEELVHNVFITYFTNPTAVRGDLRAYLIGGVCNAARSYYARLIAERTVFEEGLPEEIATGPGSDVFEGVANRLLLAATIARMGKRCREALLRYYYHGDTTAAIAADFNTSPANVNYIIHKCRKRAKEIFEAVMRVPQ